MKIKILADINSYQEVIKEQEKLWLYEILYFIGVDIEELDNMDPDAATECLLQHHITVFDYPSMGAVKVEHRPSYDEPYQIIGEWAGPEFIIKRDEETGDLYYEILIECWSIIDEQIDI